MDDLFDLERHKKYEPYQKCKDAFGENIANVCALVITMHAAFIQTQDIGKAMLLFVHELVKLNVVKPDTTEEMQYDPERKTH